MKRKNKLLKWFSIAIASMFAICVISVGGLYIFAKVGINYEADEMMVEKSLRWEPTKFYARSSAFYDDSRGDDFVLIEREGGFKKEYYPLDDISPYLLEGFVAVEDHRFYEHRGVDLKRTVKAAINYIFGGERLFGASTITQQLIKNVSGDNEVTLSRKLAEILRAVHLERLYSKDEILEVYLNIIPMGENIYGVGMAAREYFGKNPSELAPEEAATLIGITNAPTAYNPYSNSEKCLNKRNSVLAVMRDRGVITEKEYEEASGKPLSVNEKSSGGRTFDSWYIETVIDDVSRDLAKKYSMSISSARLLLERGGYSVYTNMDRELQDKLEGYFADLSNFPEEIKVGLNYAMAVTDSVSGKLLGIIGRVGEKKGNRLLNHALAPHTPASTLKPLALYAPMIDEGIINSATVFDDTPISYVGNRSEGGGYPRNSPDVYQGLITVKDAIALSKNTVAVKLCKKYGAKRAFDGLKIRFGFDTLVENQVRGNQKYTDAALSPMAMGQLTDGVSLRELTSAFGSFPSNGIYNEAYSYSKVVDMDGAVILENDNAGRRVFSRETAEVMNTLLEGVVEYGTAKHITLKEIVDCAGKTGTSSGNKDKLFVGYTPYLAAGIWCGYDRSDRGVYSLSKTHLEIWDEVMHILHERALSGEYTREFSRDGLVNCAFCKDSGKLCDTACDFDPRGNRVDYAYFTQNNKPDGKCQRHVLCGYDTVSKGIAHKSCPREYIAPVALLDIPERAFDGQIEISDAEFVYRKISETTNWPNDNTVPYFIEAVEDGTFVGISGKRKQFNCAGRVYKS